MHAEDECPFNRLISQRRHSRPMSSTPQWPTLIRNTLAAWIGRAFGAALPLKLTSRPFLTLRGSPD